MTSCLMAVRKPCGLKKPVIQNTVGRPLKHQVLNCVSRSSSSVNQNPIVEDLQEIFAHFSGTLASNMLSRTSFRSSLSSDRRSSLSVIVGSLPSSLVSSFSSSFSALPSFGQTQNGGEKPPSEKECRQVFFDCAL